MTIASPVPSRARPLRSERLESSLAPPTAPPRKSIRSSCARASASGSTQPSWIAPARAASERAAGGSAMAANDLEMPAPGGEALLALGAVDPWFEEPVPLPRSRQLPRVLPDARSDAGEIGGAEP